MPAITQEAIEACSEIMKKQMDMAMQRAQAFAAEMARDSKANRPRSEMAKIHTGRQAGVLFP